MDRYRGKGVGRESEKKVRKKGAPFPMFILDQTKIHHKAHSGISSSLYE